MSDERFAALVTVGFIAALSLWVPAIDLLQHFLRNRVVHRQRD
jgi:hypothetical protein